MMSIQKPGSTVPKMEVMIPCTRSWDLMEFLSQEQGVLNMGTNDLKQTAE